MRVKKNNEENIEMKKIYRLVNKLVKENKIMLLLVTHDPDIANTCDTIFRMDEGRICYVENDS